MMRTCTCGGVPGKFCLRCDGDDLTPLPPPPGGYVGDVTATAHALRPMVDDLEPRSIEALAPDMFVASIMAPVRRVRVGRGVLGAVLAVSGCVVALAVLLLTAAHTPETKPGTPVDVGAAQVECLAAQPSTAQPATLPAYSCPHGGRLHCTDPKGCQVYVWDADPALQGWLYVRTGRTLRLPERVYHNVVPALRAVAEVEMRP